jgi:hypothetical protein
MKSATVKWTLLILPVVMALVTGCAPLESQPQTSGIESSLSSHELDLRRARGAASGEQPQGGSFFFNEESREIEKNLGF